MEYNFSLFNAITDTLEILKEAESKLIEAQQNAEDIYIEQGEAPYLFVFRCCGTDEAGVLRANSITEAKSKVRDRLGIGYEIAQIPDLPFWIAQFEDV